MKRSRFSEEQIIGILRQAEAGVRVADLCRQYGIHAKTKLRFEWGPVKTGGTVGAIRFLFTAGRKTIAQPNPATVNCINLPWKPDAEIGFYCCPVPFGFLLTRASELTKFPESPENEGRVFMVNAVNMR